MVNKRKICILVNSRANYGRIKTVLRAVKNHPDLELQLIVGASALLYRFGSVIDIIKKDGFEPVATIFSILEGENPTTMAKSTGVAIMELATLFENLKPDIVLTVADRFETMATAVAASYMNILVAHTQGGEITGSIDEGVRHAITKLSHIHFPATALSAKNVILMGEDPEMVFNTGCPAMDIVNETDLTIPDNFLETYGGSGTPVDLSKPYLVVLQHSVTTEYGKGFEQINTTLEAVRNFGMQAFWLWPNVDAGSDDISKGIRMFKDKNPNCPINFLRNFSPEDYIRVISNSKCLIGNSSSGLRECSLLGVPTVNIGSRQLGREHGDNVIHVDHDAGEIENAIKSQIKHGKYEKQNIFGNGKAGEQIAEILSKVETRIQKRLNYPFRKKDDLNGEITIN